MHARAQGAVPQHQLGKATVNRYRALCGRAYGQQVAIKSWVAKHLDQFTTTKDVTMPEKKKVILKSKTTVEQWS